MALAIVEAMLGPTPNATPEGKPWAPPHDPPTRVSQASTPPQTVLTHARAGH